MAGAVTVPAACAPLEDLSSYAAETDRGPSEAATGSDAGDVEANAVDGGPSSTTETTPNPPDAADAAPVAVAPPPSDSGANSAPNQDAGAAPPPSPDAAVVATCAADALEGPDGDCFALLEVSLSWFAARDVCQARGAGWDLASPRSSAVSTLLADALQVESWIGATDTASEGTWRWINDDLAFWQGDGSSGQAVGGAYTNWNTSEPNGGTATNCARAIPRSVIPQSNARWADLACNQVRGAICQGPTEP
jgi:hypothetical protein